MIGMDIDTIALIAAKEEHPDAHNLHGPDRLLYYELRDIYRDYNAETLSLQTGEALKRKAVREYDRFIRKLADAEKTEFEHAKFWQRVEAAAVAYAKQPTVENADAFYEAVYRIPRSGRE